jgi:hypothetical protein
LENLWAFIQVIRKVEGRGGDMAAEMPLGLDVAKVGGILEDE